MHRKAEEEGASGANGDDDTAARRRPGLPKRRVVLTGASTRLKMWPSCESRLLR
jgi:hypothetical protein